MQSPNTTWRSISIQSQSRGVSSLISTRLKSCSITFSSTSWVSTPKTSMCWWLIAPLIPKKTKKRCVIWCLRNSKFSPSHWWTPQCWACSQLGPQVVLSPNVVNHCRILCPYLRVSHYHTVCITCRSEDKISQSLYCKNLWTQAKKYTIKTDFLCGKWKSKCVMLRLTLKKKCALMMTSLTRSNGHTNCQMVTSSKSIRKRGSELQSRSLIHKVML